MARVIRAAKQSGAAEVIVPVGERSLIVQASVSACGTDGGRSARVAGMSEASSVLCERTAGNPKTARRTCGSQPSVRSDISSKPANWSTL